MATPSAIVAQNQSLCAFTLNAATLAPVIQWKISKTNLHEPVIHFISFIRNILIKLPGGRDFLMNIMRFRNLDNITFPIFCALLLDTQTNLNVLGNIILDFYSSNCEQRKANWPMNHNVNIFGSFASTISLFLHVIVEKDIKQLAIRVYECLVAADDKVLYLTNICEVLSSLERNNYINREQLLSYFRKTKHVDDIPWSSRPEFYTLITEEVIDDISLVFERYRDFYLCNISMHSMSTTEMLEIDKCHRAIRNHRLFNKDDPEVMRHYIAFTIHYPPSEELFREILPDMKDPKWYESKDSGFLPKKGWYKRLILCKFVLYIYFPDKYPDINKNAVLRSSCLIMKSMVLLFVRKIVKNQLTRRELNEYSWFAPTAVSSIIQEIKACNTKIAYTNMEVLEKLIQIYHQDLKLRELTRTLTKSHMCRDCEKKIVMIYEQALLTKQ